MSRFTLAGPAQWEVDIKKSRFLALATPITSPEEALHFLADVSTPTATHNCWAYRLGNAYRFSDDGEPSSTAGKPILAAIDGQGLDGVMVVVTRWYGGIKLGAGGLVRAYGGTAAECLRTAARREVIDMAELRIKCDFSHSGSVHALLPTFGARKTGESYDTDGFTLNLELPATQVGALAVTLRDTTRGQALLFDAQNGALISTS